MRAVSFTCFTLLCAVAFGIPHSDEITKVPEVELAQVTSESAARAAITAMSEAGKSDAKCRDMAKAAATDIAEQIKTDQKIMDALSTGSECAAHKKSDEIGAAAKALAQAQAAAAASDQNADKAAKAPVKIGKIPLNKIGKNKCDAFFGSAYNTAVANLNAAKAAKTAADASVKAFKAAHVAATNEGSKRHQECLCSAQKASEAAMKALNGKNRAKMEAEYKKAKMMICVLDGTNTGNAACSPPLGVVTPVALTADAKNAKCAAQGPKCATSGLFITGHRNQQLEDRNGSVGVRADKGAWQKWTLSDAGDNKFFITSHRNQQLEDRNGSVGVHADKGAWQKWTLSNAGGNKYFITSHRNQQLEDRNGSVGVRADKGAWQMWSIVSADGKPPCV